jgi:DNA-binding FadR family transcriptional regulator
MPISQSSPLLEYLARLNAEPGTRLPSINELAQELGISTGKLREQLEIARVLGLVSVRPKTGIRTEDYSFFPATQASLRYALAVDLDHFEQFGVLRSHIEAAFWFEAVGLLAEDDKRNLQGLVDRAWKKLQGEPIQIPHSEHRELHLTIFSRLSNLFVRGILEAYWDAYEAVGLNLYADYEYLTQVWGYHQRMVNAIVDGDPQAGYEALVVHTELLAVRSGNRQELQPDLSSSMERIASVDPVGE